MILGNGVLPGWIVGWSLNRSYSSLPGQAALQLRAHFVGSPFFQGISATRHEKQQSE